MQLSVSDKLLLAAFELEQHGNRPFSAEDLVVSAWKKFPDTFGLAGHQNEHSQLMYPDSNRVFAEVMGSKPIRKKGFLEKVGSKMYQLTESGRAQARIYLESEFGEPVKKVALARELKGQLIKLFKSKAVEKFRNNRFEDITFYDACAFWGISPRISAIEFEGRVANLRKIIETAQQMLKDQIASFEHGGNTFDNKDLNVLVSTNDQLMRKFENEIAVITQRKDKRTVLSKIGVK